MISSTENVNHVHFSCCNWHDEETVAQYLAK